MTSDAPGGRLLAWLRKRFDAPALSYRIPPAPLPGGTEIGAGTWRLQLSGAPTEFHGPLVLRVYAGAGGAMRVIRESAVLEALAFADYPAPELRLSCTDRSVLGGAFLITQFVEGASLAQSPPAAVPGILCEAQLALHRIDPAPIEEFLRKKGVEMAPPGPANDLALLSRQAAGLPWAAPLLEWMEQNLPPAPERPALCHGDFHPLNLIVRGGAVAAVLDWPNFILADPALDVGATLALAIPARHLISPAPPQALWEAYLDGYRRQSPLEDSALDYYRARRYLKALLSAARGSALWGRPAILSDVAADLRRRTGVILPPAALQ